MLAPVGLTTQMPEAPFSTILLDPCDYLVVGTGACSIAFIDTLLSDQPTARIVLVDKRVAPGGHWIDAYDFVRLHQPSMVYGVSSKQLEGNWAKLLLLEQTLPWHHRATKAQLLKYYKDIVDEWVSSGHVRYYPECGYDFSAHDNNVQDEAKKGESDQSTTHMFTSVDGSTNFSVKS